MRGLSQQKLADQIGLKRNNIASYEAGVVEPRSVNFLKLAIFFDVAPHSLLSEDLADQLMPEQDEGEATMRHERLSEALAKFAHGTEDLQKVVEGFQEFYRLKEQQQSPVQQREDIHNALGIMEQLLSANWKLLQELTKD